MINSAMNSFQPSESERIVKRLDAAALKKLKDYKLPTQYTPCGSGARMRAEKAFIVAEKEILEVAEGIPRDLEDATCDYAVLGEYTWARLLFVSKDDKLCTKYVVFKWIEASNKKSQGPTFELQINYTLKANNGLHCKNRFDDDSKIQIDEIQAAQIQRDEVNFDVNPVIKLQVEIVQDKKLTDNSFQEGRSHVIASSHLPLLTLPHSDNVAHTKRSDIRFSDEDISESESYAHKAASSRLNLDDFLSAKTHLLGGPENCNESDKLAIPRVFTMLIAQNKLTGIHVYSQNVESCNRQIVTGVNYNVIVALNLQKCQIAFHRAVNGEVSLLTSAPKFEGIEECTEVYKPLN